MIIPPFRDTHVHFFINGKEVSREGILSIGKALLLSGIFEIWEMGFRNANGFEAVELLKEFLNVRVSGVALYKRGSYGSFLGTGISGISEIRAVVEDLSRKGADFLKVINSGIVSPRVDGLISDGGFSFEELKYICSAGREKGLDIVCHASGTRAIEDAIRAGVSSIEHGYMITEELLHMMKEKNISWTPTLYALYAFSETLPEGERIVIERIIKRHMDLIHWGVSTGVKINIGTDSGARGVEHGKAFFEELRLFRKAGLSSDQILSIACMDKKEISKGNYLVVDDFIGKGMIKAVYLRGKDINSIICNLNNL